MAENKELSTVVGIDLGTTNSVVSYPIKNEKGELEVKFIPNLHGDYLTPSFIYVGDNNRFLVGAQAKDKMAMDPTKILSSYKPYVGTDHVIGTINGREYNAYTATAIALKYMKAGIEKYLGKPLDGAVITVPAYFDEIKKRDTTKAAEEAGIKVLEITPEPTASAFTYLRQHEFTEEEVETGKTILVYDIGGGTFDVSIVYVTAQGTAYVMGLGGDQYLGGDDFDTAIANYVQKKFLNRHKLDEHQIKKLTRSAEATKIAMMEDYDENKEYLIDISNLNLNTEIQPTISVAEYEELTKVFVDNTMEITSKVLTEAGLVTQGNNGKVDLAIDEVVLVGGSSRLRNVRKALDDLTGGRFHLTEEDPYIVKPDYAVSYGASVRAQLILDGERDKVTNILSKNLGIADSEGRTMVFLEKGSGIPCRSSKRVTNSRENQDILEIIILEGDNELASDNIPIGKAVIDLPEGLREGELDLSVTFKINSNGILEVSTSGDYSRRVKIDLKRDTDAENDAILVKDTVENAEFLSDISEDNNNSAENFKKEESKDENTTISWGDAPEMKSPMDLFSNSNDKGTEETKEISNSEEEREKMKKELSKLINSGDVEANWE